MFVESERASRRYGTHPQTFSNRYALVIFRRSARDAESFATRTGVPWVSYFSVGKVSSGLSTIVYANRSIFITLPYTYNIFIALSLIYKKNPCSIWKVHVIHLHSLILQLICFILVQDRTTNLSAKKYYLEILFLGHKCTCMWVNSESRIIFFKIIYM